MRNKKMWEKNKIYHSLIANILWQVMGFEREQCKTFPIKEHNIKPHNN